jgi:GNAT superfamily N-acetyltransferase
VQPLQLELAEVTLAISDNKPLIVVCCSPLDTQRGLPFPTIIQVAGYSRPALEAAAALIFAEKVPSDTSALPNALSAGSVPPKLWQVEEFEEQKDMKSILMLWREYGGIRFKLDQQTLANVLRKPGYSKHYVVRDPPTGEALGFCATYLSYIDREGEKLVASLAILVVHPERRLQGIGLSLHSHAITQLKRTRGITRLQLGSTFPRILYGPPSNMRTSDGWLHRRGWLLDRELPGQGQAVYDLILDFKDWQYRSCVVPTSTNYRLCTQEDMTKVLEVVEKASTADDRLGWFDQYWALINGPNVKDIIVATEGYSIVGTALTYRPGSSQISSDLPVRVLPFLSLVFILFIRRDSLRESITNLCFEWSCQLGNDVGGVTCVSISCEWPPHSKSSIFNYFMGSVERPSVTRLFLPGMGHIYYCYYVPKPYTQRSHLLSSYLAITSTLTAKQLRREGPS